MRQSWDDIAGNHRAFLHIGVKVGSPTFTPMYVFAPLMKAPLQDDAEGTGSPQDCISETLDRHLQENRGVTVRNGYCMVLKYIIIGSKLEKDNIK